LGPTIDALVTNVIELLQCIDHHWVTVDLTATRQILDMALLNPPLGNITPYYKMGKPLENLVKASFVPSSRGDKTPVELLPHAAQKSR
jgi:hypothetical protein